MDVCVNNCFFIYLFMFIICLTALFMNLIYVNWICWVVTE